MLPVAYPVRPAFAAPTCRGLCRVKPVTEDDAHCRCTAELTMLSELWISMSGMVNAVMVRAVFCILGSVAVVLTASLATPSPSRADDAGIPAKCRPVEAEDNPRCADIIDSRSIERNKRGNQRDGKANNSLKDAILASRTNSGETIARVLEYVPTRIPFYVTGWHFVYARSGAEYAVLSYDSEKPASEASADEARQVESFLDYDLETDPAMSLRNSSSMGYVVWKVNGTSFVPWGSYANMIALGSRAFTWAVNQGREGFNGSGYDDAVAHDFSFFGLLPAGDGKLSDTVDLKTADKLTFYWNVVDGYTVRAANLGCPPRKVGDFDIEGENCAERAVAERDISGNVLPFKVIGAIRNHGYKDGIVAADVSVSVEGGGPGDWLATAAYLAEHSIVAGVTFATVSVFVPNPWTDFPPQRVKLLAKVYYAPDPSRSPWTEKWTIIGAQHAATPADVEFDELSNDLIEDPDKVPDPDKRLQRAEAAARRAVIQKYRLPASWKPTDNLGLDGQQHDRDHLHITGPGQGDDSLAALNECLTSRTGNGIFQGCRGPGRP
jgi:hypothetical protein